MLSATKIVNGIREIFWTMYAAVEYMTAALIAGQCVASHELRLPYCCCIERLKSIVRLVPGNFFERLTIA